MIKICGLLVGQSYKLTVSVLQSGIRADQGAEEMCFPPILLDRPLER